MASTGEVAAFGVDIHEAYWSSLLSTNGFKVPKMKSGVLIGGDIACPQLATVAKELSNQGFKLYCSSPAVEAFLNSLPYLKVERIFFPVKDKRKLLEVMDKYNVQLVINLAKTRGTSLLDKDYVARRSVSPPLSLLPRTDARSQERCRLWYPPDQPPAPRSTVRRSDGEEDGERRVGRVYRG